MKKTLLVASLLFASLAAQAGPVTVGQNGGGNCYPFSCLASDGGSVYQQVYSASAFAEAGTIHSISFYRRLPGAMDSATYTLRLSTTSHAVGALDFSPSNNIGSDVSLFGTFTLGGAMPEVLTFTGLPFHYDPTLGNLLLDVAVSDLTEAHKYESYFQADLNTTVTSRLWAGSGNGQGAMALVTTFDIGPSTAVPEPGSLLLVGLGLAGLATAGRKRKAA